MSNTVVYVMEASTGELVAASNGETIFTDTGVQKKAVDAATELISSSAARIASLRASATGTYSDPNHSISTTVIDYQRASGSLHHKIVLASYLSAVPGTVAGPAATPVPATDVGPTTVAIAGTTLVAVLALALALAALCMSKKAGAPALLVKSDAKQEQA